MAGLKDAAMISFGHALKNARSIQDDVLRAQISGDIARAQAGIGLASDASKTLSDAVAASKPFQFPQQATPTLLLINAEADIGNFTEAVGLARSMGQGPLRPTMLYVIAKAEAKSGKIAEAIELAQSIDVPQGRALALAEIAGAM